MPNTFKNSITNITNTNQTSCYTAPSSSGNVGIVVGLLISNDDASNDTTATVAITDTSASATRNILNMSPGISLMVDAKTYAAIEAMAPELLDRVSTRG